MSTAGTLGGTAGGIAGGILGGIIGGIFGPPGIAAGRWLGSHAGRWAGAAAAEALSSMMEEAGETADEDVQADETEAECENCRNTQCEELSQQINDRLHANKRQTVQPGQPIPRNHGLFPRRLEQMCGEHGPGTPSWEDHAGNILNDQANLERLTKQYEALECRGHPDDDLDWSEIDEALSEDFAPTTHLGPTHEACIGHREMMRDGRGQEALDRLRYWEFQSPPSGPALS